MPESYYETRGGDITSGQNDIAGTMGDPLKANAGEHGLTPAGRATDASLSDITAGNKQIGIGAQVGMMRNLEFTAGGRAHRISTGPYTKA